MVSVKRCEVKTLLEIYLKLLGFSMFERILEKIYTVDAAKTLFILMMDNDDLPTTKTRGAVKHLDW